MKYRCILCGTTREGDGADKRCIRCGGAMLLTNEGGEILICDHAIDGCDGIRCIHGIPHERLGTCGSGNCRHVNAVVTCVRYDHEV